MVFANINTVFEALNYVHLTENEVTVAPVSGHFVDFISVVKFTRGKWLDKNDHVCTIKIL